MKVIVVGAGGRLGSRVLAASVRAGHDTTAFVRSRERLRTAIGDDLLSRVAVVEGDAADKAQLMEAMRGHEAAVQTAGYIGRTYEEGKPLHDLVVSATEAALEALVGARRLWVVGGAGALDLPGRGLTMLDVPGFPLTKYRIHADNYEFLRRAEHASLDWSFACPGVMTDAPTSSSSGSSGGGGGGRDGGSGSRGNSSSGTNPSTLDPAGRQLAARVTVDELPVPLPPWAALLPNMALLPAIAAIRGQLVGPSYEEVAGAMVEHLAPGGPLRHRRVGFAAAAPAGRGS